ncbi:MAG TPA: hypothetical protein VGH99_12110 [Pseudonocardia sp.]
MLPGLHKPRPVAAPAHLVAPSATTNAASPTVLPSPVLTRQPPELDELPVGPDPRRPAAGPRERDLPEPALPGSGRG